MKVGPDGYLDEISRPQQELGWCYLTWIYHLRDSSSDRDNRGARSRRPHWPPSNNESLLLSRERTEIDPVL